MRESAETVGHPVLVRHDPNESKRVTRVSTLNGRVVYDVVGPTQ